MNTPPQEQQPALIPEHILETVKYRHDPHDHHEWVHWAWAALIRSGDAPVEIDEDHEDYVAHLITLAGVQHLFATFQQVAAGDNADREPDLDLLADDGRPGITTIELVRFCEQQAIYDSHDPETEDGLLHAAIVSGASAVRRRLLETLGEPRLFTSLVVAGQTETDPDDTRPPIGRTLTEDAFDRVAASVLTGDFMGDEHRAFSWLRGDLDLGGD